MNLATLSINSTPIKFLNKNNMLRTKQKAEYDTPIKIF